MRRLALALLVSTAAMAARAAEAPDAGLETYMLKMPNVLKMAHAFETLDALAKKNPALRAKVAGDDEGSGDPAHLIATGEGDPL